MGTPKILTREQAADHVQQAFAGWELDQAEAEPVLDRINGWLARGDGAAFYVNQDLGHPHLGEYQIVSWGSPVAQLEVLEADDLPERLPDIGGRINWRFTLVGAYRGETLG
jgi:hypothetical protein